MYDIIALCRYQVEHPGFDFSSASLDKNYEDEAAVSRMDDLQNLGAAALPTLSIGDNKVPYHLFFVLGDNMVKGA